MEIKEKRKINPEYEKGQFKVYCYLELDEAAKSYLRLISNSVKELYKKLTEIELLEIADYHLSLTDNGTLSYNETLILEENIKRAVDIEKIENFRFFVDLKKFEFLKSEDEERRYIVLGVV